MKRDVQRGKGPRASFLFPRRLYYGWVVAGAAFFVALTLGESFWSFGVFFKPLQQEFGWSRALTSSVNTLFLLAYAPSAFIMGRLAGRYGPRPILYLGGALTGLGFLLSSQVHSLNELRLFNALAGFGAGATWSVPTATVQRWFIKRRGLVLGLVVSGVGVGGTVFPPLTNYLIQAYGWRETYAILGFIYLFMIAAAGSLMEHSPESRGLKPYGAEEGQDQIATKVWRPGEWTARQALTSRAFLLLALTYVLSMAPVQIVLVHVVPFAVDMEVTPAAAATALAVIGASSVPGRIVMGMAADRLGWTLGLSLANFGTAVAMVLLLLTHNPWMLYAFSVLYGLGHGARVPMFVGAVSYFFGTVALGELIGVLQGIGTLTSAFGPYLAGFIFDTTQSYFLAFLLAGLSWVAAGILALRLKPPRPPTEIEGQPIPVSKVTDSRTAPS